MLSPTSNATPGPFYTFRLSNLSKLDLQVDRFHPMAATVEILSGLDQREAAKQVEALSLCFSRETLSEVQSLQ